MIKFFSLWGQQSKEISLPCGRYEIVMKMGFWKRKDTIVITNETKNIEFKHCFSESFYILGVLGVFLHLIMVYNLKIQTLYMSTYLLIYMILLYIGFFLKRNKLFYILYRYTKDGDSETKS